MRAPAQYVALRDIKLPDSYAYAARAGDDVTESQRANLSLEVGLDVEPLTPDAMPKPPKDAPRSEWQSYAVVRGVPYAEAVDLDRDALMAAVEAKDAPAAKPRRSAPKQDPAPAE